MPYLGFLTKNAFFFPFLGGIMKNIWPYLKSAPSNLSNCKIWRKNKFRKFQKKNALFGYFSTKMSYLRIFVTKLSKYYCHIWNQHREICLFARIHEKTKIPKLETENTLFVHFWGRIVKKLSLYLNSAPQNLYIWTISWKKTKMSKFETQNEWFGKFWSGF